MIEIVTRLLREKGLIKSDDAPKFNFLFTKGTCIVAHVIVSQEKAYFIKFSELSNLRNEYALIEKARKLYPDFVPKQYGYYSVPQLDMIISDRVQYSPVSAPCISRVDSISKITGVERFLSATQQSGDAAVNNTSHQELLSNTYSHLESVGNTGFLERCIQIDEINNLPSRAQHGDFVHNNLGEAKNRLYVFDWEDYGKVCLPGFDLATFVIADTGLNADTTYRILRGDPNFTGSYSSFIERCCSALELDYQLFLRLVPIYIAVFLYLKREYGAEIQCRIRTFLSELVQHLEN